MVPHFHVIGEPFYIMVPFVQLWGSTSLVREKLGILHLFLRANSDMDEVVVVESYPMGYILGYNTNLRSHILNHVLHFLMVVVPLNLIY
jgi:hypothetical protein